MLRQAGVMPKGRGLYEPLGGSLDMVQCWWSGAGAELVGRLRAGERSRALFRQLGQYGVSIYENHFAALDQAGDLERLEDGSAILATLSLYSEETGLSLEVDCGKAFFV